MTAKNLLRRVNRGILLAVALIIGLIVWLAVDNARFTKEKDDITAMLDQYAVESASLMILPESDQNPGETVSATAVEKQLKDAQPVFDRFLTGGGRYSSANERAPMEMRNALESNAVSRTYVTGCEFKITKVGKLRKVASGYAQADISVDASFKIIGKPIAMILHNTWYTDESGQWYGKGEMPADMTYDTEIRTLSQSVTFMDVLLRKVNGEWKIAESNGMNWNSRTVVSY
ncbi:MAG: hypothetical protein LBQ48_05995 [Oscillospiraceae bacterium]|nr:hypothetical protein [Oscillospiraceae bacterium]